MGIIYDRQTGQVLFGEYMSRLGAGTLRRKVMDYMDEHHFFTDREISADLRLTSKQISKAFAGIERQNLKQSAGTIFRHRDRQWSLV